MKFSDRHKTKCILLVGLAKMSCDRTAFKTLQITSFIYAISSQI